MLLIAYCVYVVAYCEAIVDIKSKYKALGSRPGSSNFWTKGTRHNVLFSIALREVIVQDATADFVIACESILLLIFCVCVAAYCEAMVDVKSKYKALGHRPGSNPELKDKVAEFFAGPWLKFLDVVCFSACCDFAVGCIDFLFLLAATI